MMRLDEAIFRYPLANDVLSIVHAFGDEGRRSGIRKLAHAVFLAEQREESIRAILGAFYQGDDGELSSGQAAKHALKAIRDVMQGSQ